MTPQHLLDHLRHSGVKIWRDGADIEVEGPAHVLTPAIKEQIRAHKSALLALLARPVDEPTARPQHPVVAPALRLCPQHHRYLTYGELVAQACWWCHPDQAPVDHAIRSLTPAELAALVVVVRGTP